MKDKVEIIAAPASQDIWAADLRAVYDRLKQYNVVDDLDRIPLDAFAMTVGTIANFRDRPFTDDDMKVMKELGRRQLDRREAFDRAAVFLQEEIDRGGWKAIPGRAEHVRQWNAAIGILKMPRSVTEMPGSWIRSTRQGDRIRAWSYMATEITSWILWALRSYGVELRNATGLARFARDALSSIGVNNLPSEREILRVLQKNLLGAGDA